MMQLHENDAITRDKIRNNAVDTAQLETNAVTRAKIADDAVGANELRSVVSLRIKNSSGSTLKTIYGAGA